MISELLPFTTKYFNYLATIVVLYTALVELYKWWPRRTTRPSGTRVFKDDESTDPSEGKCHLENTCMLRARTHTHLQVQMHISD